MSRNGAVKSPEGPSTSAVLPPLSVSSPTGARARSGGHAADEPADRMTGLRPANQRAVRTMLSRRSQESHGFDFAQSDNQSAPVEETQEASVAIPDNVLKVILSGMPQWRADGTAALPAKNASANTGDESDSSVSLYVRPGGGGGGRDAEAAGDLTDGGYYTTPSYSAVEASLPPAGNGGLGKRPIGFPKLGDAGAVTPGGRNPPRRARRGSTSVTICTPGASPSPAQTTTTTTTTTASNATDQSTSLTNPTVTSPTGRSSTSSTEAPAQGAAARTLLQRRRTSDPPPLTVGTVVTSPATSTSTSTHTKTNSTAHSPLSSHSGPAPVYHSPPTPNVRRPAPRPVLTASHVASTVSTPTAGASRSLKSPPSTVAAAAKSARAVKPAPSPTSAAGSHVGGGDGGGGGASVPPPRPVAAHRLAEASVERDLARSVNDDDDDDQDTKPTAQFYSRAQLAQNHDGAKYLNDYMVFHDVGRGASGKVVLGYSAVSSKTVAIKIITKPKKKKYTFLRAPSVLTSDPDILGSDEAGPSRTAGGASVQALDQQLQREIDVMKNLNHKNVVRLYEVINDPTSNKIYLIMQFIDKGAVATMDPDGKLERPFSSLETARIAAQAAAGLAYLHKKGVIHRDIKPENMLINSDGTVFLADFGVAEMFPDEDAVATVDKLGFQGTPLFMAPEVYVRPDDIPILEERYGINRGSAASLLSSKMTPGLPKIDLFALDIWALGVTLITLLTGEVPFKQLQEIRQLLLDGKDMLPLPAAIPKEWRPLLSAMVQTNQKMRPSAREVRTMTRTLRERLEKEQASKPSTASHGTAPALDEDDEVLVASDNDDLDNDGPALFVPLRSNQFSPQLEERPKARGSTVGDDSASVSHPLLAHRRTVTIDGVTESKNGAGSTIPSLPDSGSRSAHSPIHVEALRPNFVDDPSLAASPVFTPIQGMNSNTSVVHRRSLPSGAMTGARRSTAMDPVKSSLKASLYKVAMNEKMT